MGVARAGDIAQNRVYLAVKVKVGSMHMNDGNFGKMPSHGREGTVGSVSAVCKTVLDE